MEKRKCERNIKRLPVFFSDGKAEHQGTTSDCSCEGMFIRTRKPFNPGTNLKIVLEISGNQNIHLNGVVIRSLKTGSVSFKDGMGVKLLSIPEVYKEFVEKLYG